MLSVTNVIIFISSIIICIVSNVKIMIYKTSQIPINSIFSNDIIFFIANLVDKYL